MDEVTKSALAKALSELSAAKQDADRRLMYWTFANLAWSIALLIVTAYMAARLWR